MTGESRGSNWKVVQGMRVFGSMVGLALPCHDEVYLRSALRGIIGGVSPTMPCVKSGEGLPSHEGRELLVMVISTACGRGACNGAIGS